MKTIKKIFISLFAFLIILGIGKVAKAMSISASSTSVKKGTSVTITINGGGLTGRINLSASSGIQLSQSSVWVEGGSASVTATVNDSGTITAIPLDVSDASGNDVTDSTSSKSVSITVVEEKNTTPVEDSDPATQKNDSNKSNTPTNTTKKPETNTKTTTTKKSADALLSALTVDKGVLTPEFDPAVKEYTVNIANDITEVAIEAVTNDSKASYSLEGETTNLQVGENIVKVIVVAEDGTVNEYVVKVNRIRSNLALQSLKIKYLDKEGKEVELKLNPEFSATVLEYKISDLEYWIEKLQIEAITNLEGAEIKIEGADSLKEGENIITITLTIPVENTEEISGEEASSEAIQENEVIVYKVIVNKEKAPTVWQNILGWFKDNQSKIIFGALVLSAFLLFVLSIFIITDYKKYKNVLAKIAEINGEKLEQVAVKNEVPNILEEISEKQEVEKVEETEEVKEIEPSKKTRGRH